MMLEITKAAGDSAGGGAHKSSTVGDTGLYELAQGYAFHQLKNQRRPVIKRPVFSSTMITLFSWTTYCTSFR